jgi:phage-related protein
MAESLGDAYVNVHARTDDVEPDIRKGLEKAGKDADTDADKVGKDVGEHLGKGVENEVARHGPAISKSIGKAVEKEVIDVTPNFRYNVRGKNGRFISKAAADIRGEVENAFSDVTSGAGGVFGKIGQAIADAIGSGVGVSGKSPLVYILAPVYAAIAGLVVAAVQAANGVIAALLAIPAAISVVLVEVGVLFLAFQGVGEAIQGAFAAKNATELTAAIKDLTPSAQSFVKALLPAKGLLADLKKSAQESFFSALGGGAGVSKLIESISKPLKAGVPVVADALGRFFAKLTAFFNSPLFAQFLDRIFPAVAQIIDMLSGPFIDLMYGLFILIVQSLPFLLDLAARFGDLLRTVGDLLAGVNPEWLQEMLGTLDQTFKLIGAVITLFAVLFSQVNKGGGKDLLSFITQAVTVLTNFLSTGVGQKAIEGLIRLGEVGIFVVLAMVEAVILLLAFFQVLTDAIAAFVEWILGDAWPAIKKFFSDFGNYIGAMVSNIKTGFTNAIGLVTNLPSQLKTAAGDFGNVLKNAGRAVVQGLIDGILSMLNPLKSALSYVGSFIKGNKGPESKDKKLLVPAGKAIMEGLGDGIMAGTKDIKSMLGDFTTDLGGIGVNQSSTHILFGANALQLNFKGALPTTDQALATGQAVGNGINSQLAARNTRLAVRTL